MYKWTRLKEYRRYDDMHRVGGPAELFNDGDMLWLEYNQKHRIDGPAKICGDDNKNYYIRGKEYTKEEYESEIHNK